MTSDDLTPDRLARVLRALPCQEPRLEPAARLRSKCHEQLAKRSRPRRALTPAFASRSRLQAEAALAGALGLLYLATVVGRALRLSGF
jgi:hypothetical protein